jgi:phenylalanyl-tRNA synthetase beta chain
MNIKITYNWLLEYLDTKAKPDEIARCLSLCGPSFESTKKIDDDYLYEIEITANRVDSASVFGIAQEAAAILPMFLIPAKIKQNPRLSYHFSDLKPQFDAVSSPLTLDIKIASENLCSRFTAVVMDNVKIQPSPEFIQKRLNAVGIKVINNVVDISNYLMVALGQPVHIFDYDQIKKGLMLMRQSKKDEVIVTLDGIKATLPGGDIVIEDGDGQLIDLCGIMGGLNSSVTEKTQRIVLFVQTYNKQKIRRTTMTTGVRTIAATYFEKGLDEEQVEPTLIYGVSQLEKYASAKIASKLYDIYPHPYQKKSVTVDYPFFEKIIGKKLPEDMIDQILLNLGFKLIKKDQSTIEVVVPSWRKYDISIPEDIVEEVARIYGYHQLEAKIQPPALVEGDPLNDKVIGFINQLKKLLKHLGLIEVMNYSMISKEQITDERGNESDYLRLSNSIWEEIVYMRRSLLPSLLKNMVDNDGKKEIIKIFEIAKVYLKKEKEIPDEIYRLAIAVNTDFYNLKGVVEAIFTEFNLEKFYLQKKENLSGIYETNRSVSIIYQDQVIGSIGELRPELKGKYLLSKSIYLAEIDLTILAQTTKKLAKYQPINPYAVIKLDLNIFLSDKLTYQEFEEKAFKSSSLLQKIELIDLFKNKATVRLYFSAIDRNLTEEEAKKELEKIKHITSNV